MKIKSILLVLAAGTMLMACGDDEPAVVSTDPVTPAEPEVTNATYTVNTAESTLGWKGAKVGGSHEGVISISEGSVSTEGGMITAGNFTVDMATMTETTEDSAMGQQLVGHLMSADFFKVDSFPTATFEITESSMSEAGDGTCTIGGNLTIIGETRNINFPATVSMDGDNMTATAEFTIDRTQWGIVYGSATAIVDMAADKAIEDNITFNVSLVATKQ